VFVWFCAEGRLCRRAWFLPRFFSRCEVIDWITDFVCKLVGAQSTGVRCTEDWCGRVSGSVFQVIVDVGPRARGVSCIVVFYCGIRVRCYLRLGWYS